MSARRAGRPTATAIEIGNGTPESAPSSCRSPSSAKALTSRASWNLDADTNGPCCRWSRRRTSTGSRPERSTTSPKRSASRASRRTRSAASARSSTPRSMPSASGASMASSHETIDRICKLFERRYPQLVKVLQEAEVDVLAYFSFPVEHRRQIWSTNSLERLNKEVSRRCDVVGIFPNRASLLRLTGAVLEEQNDEWAVGRRYFSTESMNKLYQPNNEEVVKALLELESA